MIQSGWENAVTYQYCMNLGPLEAEILNNHINYEPNNGYAFILMAMLIGEFIIYIIIVYHLWNHDEKLQLDKIITINMRQERNHKNVITLGGQAFSFFVELSVAIYCVVHMNYTTADPSNMPILIIIGSTIVSVGQFVCSHELKRYLRSEWNISIPFLS